MNHYKSCNYENILFRLSADYKARNAKTCSSENVHALSTEQVIASLIYTMILGVL